jgi:hypothetical protein
MFSPIPEIAGGYPGVFTALAAGMGSRVASIRVGRASVLKKAPGTGAV